MKLLRLGVLLLAGCMGLPPESRHKGEIKVDGSSTTYLVTQAVAEEFKKLHPGMRISVGISGTGGGFKKFAEGETDISNASRAIKPAEVEKCKTKGIDFVELQVCWDGLAVVIHKENTWARKLTVEQLRKIWDEGSTVKTWQEVEPNWPDEPIALFGAGTDSGTFDYFTEAINGKEKRIRKDYTPSEDDNVTVNGVARNKYAIGFFGLAYYEANTDKLEVAAIYNPKLRQYITPNTKTVLTRQYAPLGRPLYIYIKKSSLQRPEVQAFTRFYLRREDLVQKVKYVPLSARQQVAEQDKLEAAIPAAGT
jgi:phosphate transport system substrate-binding protein